MATEISLQELARAPGVIGAARWKASQYNTNMAAAPVLGARVPPTPSALGPSCTSLAPVRCALCTIA